MSVEDYLNKRVYLIGCYKTIHNHVGNHEQVDKETEMNDGLSYDKLYCHALIWTGKEIVYVCMMESYYDHQKNEDDIYPYVNVYYDPIQKLNEFRKNISEWGSREEVMKAISMSKWGDGTIYTDRMIESYRKQMSKLE